MATVTVNKLTARKATHAKKEDPKQMKKKLFLLMLKKANLKEADIIDMFTSLWIGQHLDLLTEEELKPYRKYIL